MSKKRSKAKGKATAGKRASGKRSQTERPRTERVQSARDVAARLDAAFPDSDVARLWATATLFGTQFQATTPFEREAARALARNEFLNNPHAAGIARLFSLYVVGVGPRLRFEGFEKYLRSTRPALSRGFRDYVERQWNAFCSEIRFAPLLRQATQSLVVDGEAFLAFAYNPKASRGFSVVPIDAGRVGNPGARVDSRTLQDGVFLDPFGNVDAYCVYDLPDVAAAQYDRNRFQMFAASDVIHLFRDEIPGQTRGVSWLAPVLKLVFQLREYTAAVVEAAKASAQCFATIETQTGFEDSGFADAVEFEPTPYFPFQTFETPNRRVMNLTPGTTMKPFVAPQPTTTADAFVAQILSQIGYPLGLPRNKATGSSHEYNFSSGRLDNQPFEMSIDCLRRDLFEVYCCDRIFAEFYRSIFPDLQLRFPDEDVPTFEDCEWTWIWPRAPLVDPEAAARTNSIRIKSGQATLEEVWRETHPFVDFEDVRAQILRDRADFPEMFGAAPDAPTPSASETRIDEPKAPAVPTENVPLLGVEQ